MRTTVIFGFLAWLTVQIQAQSYQRMLVDTLASIHFDGRGYVNSGCNRAANYLVEQMDSLGLKPINNRFKQPFPIHINTFPNRMAVTLDGKALQPGIDFLVDPMSGGGEGTLEAVSIDVYNAKDIKKLFKTSKYLNKALIIQQPDTLKGEGKSEFKAFVTSLTERWPVIVKTSEKLTWGVGNRELPFPLIWLKTKDHGSINTVELSIDHKMEHQTVANVMGMIPGSESNGRYVLVTAHYDHLGRMGRETYFPGANDNASGVAEMMALAAYFAEHPLKINLLFVAFAGEEAGLVGSRYFVYNSPVALDSIDFVLNLDLSGTGEDGITVVNATLYPEAFENLKQLNNDGGFVKEIKARGPAANSDHYFFTEAGVPAFFIYTRGGLSAYHDVYDRPETLPLTEAEDLKALYIRFLEQIPK